MSDETDRRSPGGSHGRRGGDDRGVGRAPRPARHVDPARHAAFDALEAVTIDGAYANLALQDILRERNLDARDAAFATELLYGTCRALGSYDAIIERAARRGLETLEPGVIDVLRLACHQLFAMRVPTHAAVDSSVDLAATAVGQRTRRLVNAICRKLSQRDLDSWNDALAADLNPTAAAAQRAAHPEWIVAALADVLPADELDAALAANNVAPSTTLAVRPGLCERDDLPGEPTRLSPFGVVASGDPGRIDAVRTGRAGVQDEGSQLVCAALAAADAPSGSWLDLCAGPGGKAALLRGLAGDAVFVANETHPHRAQLVRRALRAYPGLAHVVVADGRRPAWANGAFARVMADVPCSGLGALRRRPEARWRKWPEDVTDLAELQRGLLAAALDSAAPGGVVAYVTCSPHRAETADVVAAVLADRPEVEILDAPALLPQVPDASADTDPRFLQLWPHRHGTDAMFCALLRVGSAGDGR